MRYSKVLNFVLAFAVSFSSSATESRQPLPLNGISGASKILLQSELSIGDVFWILAQLELISLREQKVLESRLGSSLKLKLPAGVEVFSSEVIIPKTSGVGQTRIEYLGTPNAFLAVDGRRFSRKELEDSSQLPSLVEKKMAPKFSWIGWYPVFPAGAIGLELAIVVAALAVIAVPLLNRRNKKKAEKKAAREYQRCLEVWKGSRGMVIESTPEEEAKAKRYLEERKRCGTLLGVEENLPVWGGDPNGTCSDVCTMDLTCCKDTAGNYVEMARDHCNSCGCPSGYENAQRSMCYGPDLQLMPDGLLQPVTPSSVQ